ncbi:metallophosphoesterase [Catenovulum sediminis]|uniref:Metallophosphoesterase n=1 Tax=Catenovulum sediminis TaxID=1740262 RepID=A0ABV1RJH0_9ALTE
MNQLAQLKLSVMSDIHLGCFAPDKLPDFELAQGIDVLVLARDIMDGVKSHGIDWVLNLNPNIPIIYIAGNHEYYGSRRDKAIRNLTDAFANTNVRFLINDTVTIKGYKFIVTDLWTDYQLRGDIVKSTNFARSRMNDFRKIKFKSATGYRKLRPLDTVQWHIEAKHFIQTELNNCQEEIPISVTHHATHPLQLEPAYKNSEFSPAYASDMTEFFNQCKTKPVLAINGHSNYCHSDGIYYYSNPFGYHDVEVVHRFDSKAMLELDGSKVKLTQKDPKVLSIPQKYLATDRILMSALQEALKQFEVDNQLTGIEDQFFRLLAGRNCPVGYVYRYDLCEILKKMGLWVEFY